MKICVMCPGSFTNGLDSAERGESRWSQNYAKMLALAGHDVYAASMGRPDPRIHYGVKLINELEVKSFGPYDLYIDSSWWKEKQPYSMAKKYVILKWSLEDYTREIPLGDDFSLAYPYPSHHWEFTRGVNANKTFALPTMFGVKAEAPKWDNNKIFLPGKIDTNRDYKRFMPAIMDFMRKYPMEGVSKTFFKEELKDQVFFDSPNIWHDLIPYNDVLQAMRRCKISLPILNPGCMIEATFQGLPSIFWGHGGFFNDLGSMLDILIAHAAEPERFTEVANLLMTNKKKYHEVVRTMQDYFSYHTYEGSLAYFNLMKEQIF